MIFPSGIVIEENPLLIEREAHDFLQILEAVTKKKFTHE